MSDIAYYRLEISDQFVKHGKPDRLAMFRLARERAVDKVRGLVPGSRPLFAVSKTNKRTYSVEVFTSEDRPKVVHLLRRLQTTRKQWKGYRTMEDYMDDNP